MQKIGFCERYMLTTAVLNRAMELTRRLEKGLENLEEGNFYFNRATCEIYLYGEKGSVIETIKTRYKLGEVVAVAQRYETLANSGYLDQMTVPANNPVQLEFKKEYTGKGWSNKMFVRADLMPHQIQITDINIVRLHDISEEDCLKEGIVAIKGGFGVGFGENYNVFGKTPREAFAALIDRPGVGRKGLWKSNPFVVVYEFKLVK